MCDLKLTRLRLSNFQSFGAVPTVIDLAALCFLLGPNGTGKTAVLQALARMFGLDPGLRRVRKSDFHYKAEHAGKAVTGPLTLWIEAEFKFPELKKAKGKHATIPVHFAHMQLVTAGSVPRVRFRLTATLDEDGDIEEAMQYVIAVDKDDEPTKSIPVQKYDRSAIHVHYLPAKRDPADHISFAANALLGRALRAADWHAQSESIAALTEEISESLSSSAAIVGIGQQLASHWSVLHKGHYYANPAISFAGSDIDSLLRHLSLSFEPGAGEPQVAFSRLSDGQQSLLYLALVLSMQAIGRKVLAKKIEAFDVDKLRPAVFTLIAMEEPENSLSPHYLGRVLTALREFAAHDDAQAIVATHAPSLLRRVEPEQIRYLRLNPDRQTVVSTIVMPNASDEAYKFVREAVQAFPELYFSRLVILGEGDSEEIVLPRLLRAKGLAEDEVSVCVVPLGGRHVNHFWRLLHGLGIPHVTLLDLDLGRNQGGWGRVRYALQQLLKFPTIESNLNADHIKGLPKWNGEDALPSSKNWLEWRKFLESAGVFFSAPLDLDFAMLRQFPAAYGMDDLVDPETSDENTIPAVLGKEHGDADQYSDEEQEYFATYHRRFKLGSKPATHLAALAQLDDADLAEAMPRAIGRMLDLVKTKLSALPE